MNSGREVQKNTEEKENQKQEILDALSYRDGIALPLSSI